MLLTGSTYRVTNRLAKNEFVELDLWAKHFNEEPACPEMVQIFLSYDYFGYWF